MGGCGDCLSLSLSLLLVVGFAPWVGGRVLRVPLHKVAALSMNALRDLIIVELYVYPFTISNFRQTSKV